MAITATAKKINIKKFFLLSFFISTSIQAEIWKFSSNIGLDENYTDELSATDKTSSLISRMNASINTQYDTRTTKLSLSGNKSYTFHNQNNQLNTDYRSLNASGRYSPFLNGPTITANANIANISTLLMCH